MSFPRICCPDPFSCTVFPVLLEWYLLYFHECRNSVAGVVFSSPHRGFSQGAGHSLFEAPFMPFMGTI